MDYVINKVYTDADRALFAPMDDRMRTELVPAMYSRKIHRSTVQSAALLQAATDLLRPRASILGAGSYEDLVCASLKELGFRVTDVDPVWNSDLHTWIVSRPHPSKYDAVVSTSVLEHTHNDEEFIADCASLLKIDGICFMTMDFQEGWVKGQPVPPTSLRFYTRADLEGRLKDVVEANGCELLPYDWSDADDFWYAGFTYGFAGFSFKRVK